MGPRLKDVEDINAFCQSIKSLSQLQWGHVSRTWKTTSTSFAPPIRPSLQWGHVSRTWKTRRLTARLAALFVASMGPRLKDVEDLIGSSAATLAGASLQWGHVSRTWKTIKLPENLRLWEELQWGHVSRTWKTETAESAAPKQATLQWGHVSRTWKTGVCVLREVHAEHASMGPRLKDVEDSVLAAASGDSFVLQWGHVSRTWKTTRATSPATAHIARFNGATSQGRGRHPPRSRWRLGLMCFNGATSQGRGRHHRRQPLSRHEHVASMGPRLKDVEDGGSWTDSLSRVWLQWGHVSRTWKTCCANYNYCCAN